MGRKAEDKWLSPRRFWLLPLISGAAWFITLASLLLFWLAQGRPRYPFQADPDVAYARLPHGPSILHQSLVQPLTLHCIAASSQT